MKTLATLFSSLYLLTWLFTLSLLTPTHAADLTFTPATPLVEINKTITLSVQGAVGTVTWATGKGTIQGDGLQVTYLAPAQAGFDVVSVLDSAGNYASVKVVITLPNDFSLENAQWEVFTNRSHVQALSLSEDGKTLWVGTNGGLEKRDVQTGEMLQVLTNVNGLPANWVSALLPDSQGGLWIGTVGGGLAHYAQSQWQVFNSDNSGLPSNEVWTFLSDNQGGLWVGTSGGLAHYAQGQWQTFNTDNSGLPNNWVNTLLPDSQGGLWIGTGGGGLVHHVQEQWQVFNTENSGLPYDFVLALLPDNQGGLWVGTGNGLAHYTQGQWQVFNFNQDYNQDNPDSTSNWVYTIVHDSQGGLWVGNSNGLAHYAQGQWQFFDPDHSGLPHNRRVTALLNDNQGGLWVGTWIDGLAHYAQGQWQFFDSSFLPSNNVSTLLPDGQSGLWVGTQEDEFERWAGTSGGLAHYVSGTWQVFNRGNSGLPDNNVTAFLSDDQSGLWIGTWIGGLAHYAQGQWQVFNMDNSGLPSDSVNTLLSDNQGGLWLSMTGGLAHYTQQGQWQTFNTDNSDLPSNDVTALLPDSQGGLWVGTRSEWDNEKQVLVGGGVAYLNAQGQWQVFNTNNSGLPSNNVAALLLDSQGGLWVGTFLEWNNEKQIMVGGEVAYLNAQRQWQVFNSDNSGLPNSSIVAFLHDSQGGLWIRTGNSGLVHYASGSWQVFNTDNSGLPSNEVSNILLDSQGGLWVGTSQGLAHYTAQGQWQVFQTDNSGLPSNRVNALLSDSQGGLWIGGVGGERGYVGGLAHLTFSRQAELCTQAQIDAATCQAILTVDNKMSATTMMLTAGQSVTLQAKATSMPSTVNRVWAVIRPPAIAQILDTNGTPILAFPRLELGHAKDNPELWQGTWNEAVYNGNYLITFYAEDNEKNIASSEQDTVLTVTGGVDLPAQAQVQIHLEKDRYQRGEPFKVSLTEELGWGYDLYAAVLLPDKQTFLTLKETNGLRPVNEAKPWYAPRKPHSPVTLLDLTVPATLPTGEYCLFGILSPAQGDVFETAKQNLWVTDTKCVEVVP